MARYKKRLKIKKRLPKKVMKRKQPTTNNNGKTAEQQAKEVDMLKTMLSRAQPPVVGQTQQKHEDHFKIDTLNKMYDNLRKEAEGIRSRHHELQNLIQAGKDGVKQAKEEIKHEEAKNKQIEQNIQNKQEAEQRVDEAKEKGEKLRKIERQYDGRTVEGKHKKET